ncbi:MAG: putative ATP-dependent exoDNAse [Frankiales bacterium]|nr:putative ATP-dependent exoDNAse [Frankiales bacterium]
MTASPEEIFTAFVEASLWPGLGKTLGAQLAEHGIRVPDDVLPSRLAKLPSIGLVRAERLVEAFAGAADRYEVATLLVPAGLPARLAFRALEALGPAAADLLREDPWRLLDVPDVRLAEADRLARALLGAQARPDDPRRGVALVAHVLVRAAADGHTCLSAEDVARGVQAEGYDDTQVALESALEGERVVASGEDPPVLSLSRYAMAEEAVADGIARLLATAEPLADEAAARAVQGQLDEVQTGAVALAMRHGVSVLTGGPGTGKSRTVAALVALARARRKKVALAAPTGRAAKRLEELCDAPAVTLHRLLGAQGMSGGFTRGEDWPLDEDVIVVDEASMLDVELAAALLEACPDGAHVLFVGDPAQLPSIGAGRVLGDLVDSGVVPVTELTTLYRQAEGGAIARLATAVRAGELPPVEDDPAREVVVVNARAASEAAHRTVQLVTDSIPRVLGIPAGEIQVVTPVHRGPAGTIALNAALKARLNPGSGEVQGFDVGDRVVATANHLDEGFANGEVGVVTGRADRGLVISFAGAGPVTVPPKALIDLRHGWAVTVHRAQGSEFPAVVAVLPAEAGGLLSRPLVYTAFTRAQRHLSVVHSAGAALARAVREVGALPRRTRLAPLLKEAVEAL